ncbi:MAG: protein phosphatase Slingshot [Edafosvirus sp.]|uniref:Protein phosphatase Slingshot n=1 Tax=Edafosvirus sp. TaxID=2487765 RepID=A0A3G4ZTF0_9VIRU|nr:MAG: protein phosphatase Slingshot [Edafosvirus sp.]
MALQNEDWWQFLESNCDDPKSSTDNEKLLKILFNKTELDIYDGKHENKVMKKKESKICPKCCHFIDASEEDHNANHMVEIVPHLYIGGVWNAHNMDELINNEIDTIINVAYEVENKFIDSFKYKKYFWDDREDQQISHLLVEIVDAIHNLIKEGKNVLVHCYMGRSRSGSVIIAYLMKYHEQILDDAIKFARSKKYDIWPNNGFINELKYMGEHYLEKSEKIDKHTPCDMLNK